MTQYTKWVAAWGNAMSYRDQTEAMYAKDLTLRYPIRIFFSGSALRFHFTNLTGREPVTLQASAAKSAGGSSIVPDTSKQVTAGGKQEIVIDPGKTVMSDELQMDVTAGETVAVTLYMAGYTDLNSGVLITGPLSGGYYSYGEFLNAEDLPIDVTRKTNWYQFLETVDILTEEKNHALICYGDSITAQSWPDDLALRAWEDGYHDISIIRRAVSGTRILREYDCITYLAYGLKGEHRFSREMETAGADRVLIQHGINDIIHPVGTDVNPFRPWSDLPTAEQMEEGYRSVYLEHAKKLGLKIYSGTLLPICGWRTYADFRETLKNEFNDWLRTEGGPDGCADFDLALRDPEHPESFRKEYDSGDHLHPSAEGYRAMAYAVPEICLK